MNTILHSNLIADNQASNVETWHVVCNPFLHVPFPVRGKDARKRLGGRRHGDGSDDGDSSEKFTTTLNIQVNRLQILDFQRLILLPLAPSPHLHTHSMLQDDEVPDNWDDTDAQARPILLGGEGDSSYPFVPERDDWLTSTVKDQVSPVTDAEVLALRDEREADDEPVLLVSLSKLCGAHVAASDALSYAAQLRKELTGNRR